MSKRTHCETLPHRLHRLASGRFPRESVVFISIQVKKHLDSSTEIEKFTLGYNFLPILVRFLDIAFPLSKEK